MLQIGFAGVGHIHTPGFVDAIKKRGETIKVKSVWDHQAARAKKRAGDLGAAVVKTPAQLFGDPEIAAVVICSETKRHEKLVLEGAKAKKHLFVEKPLGMAARDGWVMAKAIEEAGVLFQTGYGQRGWPINLFLKEQIAKGSFGKITRVRGSNCHSGAIGQWFNEKPEDAASSWRWMADPKLAGVGAFGDLGTHSLDILIWLMGEVTQVTAQLDNGLATYPGCDETGEAMLRFKSGVIGTLAAGWDDVANPVSLLISGTEGHAVVVNGQLFFQSKHVEGADGKQPWTALPPRVPAAFDAFLDAILGVPGIALVSAREAAYCSAVMGAMYQGAKKNKWVAPVAAL